MTVQSICRDPAIQYFVSPRCPDGSLMPLCGEGSCEPSEITAPGVLPAIVKPNLPDWAWWLGGAIVVVGFIAWNQRGVY